MTNLTANFTGQEFDLDAAILSAGISYTSDFQIKFQQYDNYPWSTDGRAFDNIIVESSQVPVFDSNSDDFSNVPFMHVQTGDVRTYNGQNGYAGTSYTQTASSEQFLGVNCLRVDETGVSGNDKESYLILMAKDTSGVCWLFKFVEDDFVQFEAANLSEAIMCSDALHMRLRLLSLTILAIMSK